MSEFNRVHNFTHSKIRRIIIAILANLQDKLEYEQFIDIDTKRTIKIPFYYNQSGSADFLTDAYLSATYANNTLKVDGNTLQKPRGIISLSSAPVDTGGMTNRTIRCTIPKRVDDTTFKMYSYETNIVPMTLSFDCRVICTSFIEMLEIHEKFLETFYKHIPFYVDFGGYRVEASMAWPEDYQHEKLVDFTYSDKEQYDLTFSIDVSTYFPIFDMKSEIFVGDNIQNTVINIYDSTDFKQDSIYSNSGEREVNQLLDTNIIKNNV